MGNNSLLTRGSWIMVVSDILDAVSVEDFTYVQGKLFCNVCHQELVYLMIYSIVNYNRIQIHIFMDFLYCGVARDVRNSVHFIHIKKNNGKPSLNDPRCVTSLTDKCLVF